MKQAHLVAKKNVQAASANHHSMSWGQNRTESVVVIFE